jgi:membrane protein involved in colicin uptake
LKRKHELQRRKAEAQLQMLKVKQQIEAEQVVEMEKSKPAEPEPKVTTPPSASPFPAAPANATAPAKKALSQVEIKAEADKKAAAEKKVADEKAKAEKKAADDKAKAEKEKKEADEKKAAEAKKKALMEEKHSSNLTKLNEELDSFSVNLNQKHYKAAIALRDEIKSAGFEDPAFKVHTTNVYKKSFTFPQIANNDYAIEQFEALSVAEVNLNNDVTNEPAME